MYAGQLGRAQGLSCGEIYFSKCRALGLEKTFSKIPFDFNGLRDSVLQGQRALTIAAAISLAQKATLCSAH
jgi:hypothetical protein